MIILLDLNYTLVGNSVERKYVRPWTRKIGGETYRRELVDLLKAGGHHVILITARPEYQREVTMARIAAELDWEPDEVFFNEHPDTMDPPTWKEHALRNHIFPVHGEDGSLYFAFESNGKTHAMYAKYGIASARMVALPGRREQTTLF